MTDGHFANYGDLGVRYYYNGNASDQIPDNDKIVGVLPFDANPSFCISIPCVHPCPDGEDLSEYSEGFYILYPEYLSEMDAEEYESAAYYRQGIDSILNYILRWYELDTSDFTEDTLRAWYNRTDAISGRIHLAKDYLQTGHYNLSLATIDSIIAQFTLEPEQLIDMARLLAIIDVLSNRSIDSLTNQDIDSLLIYSQGTGSSYAMSRSILTELDSVYTPRYFVPSEIYPRAVYTNLNEETEFSQDALFVYPNPASEEITFSLAFPINGVLKYEIRDLGGRIVQNELFHLTNQITTSTISTVNLINGIYILRIEIPGVIHQAEKIIIIK